MIWENRKVNIATNYISVLPVVTAVEVHFGGYEYKTVAPAVFMNKKLYCNGLS